tara:strand:+ start:374 stop:1150 length:777 start_codon:yes stop_codon:yes gene_type:complete
MEIEMKKNEFEDILDRVEMRGKYYDGEAAKNGVLSNYVHIEVIDDKMVVTNGDNTTACVISSESVLEEIEDSGNCVLDISKLSKYLAPFSGDTVTFKVDGYVTLDDGNYDAKLPVVVEHPAITMVNLVRERFAEITALHGTEKLPTFGKTKYDNYVKVNTKELREAIKGCDVTNLARYKFVFDGDNLTISSQRSMTDSFTSDIIVVESVGDGASVEFTGNITKFLGDERYIYIYLRDDSPVIVTTANSMLVKAPYLRR